MSLVWATGSVAEEYTPKAHPFGDDPSFWEKLHGQEEEHTANISEWLELNLYKHSKLAVEKVTEGDNTALKSLSFTPMDLKFDLKKKVSASHIHIR